MVTEAGAKATQPMQEELIGDRAPLSATWWFQTNYVHKLGSTRGGGAGYDRRIVHGLIVRRTIALRP